MKTKISSEAARAFLLAINFERGNTKVESEGDVSTLDLYGNTIAIRTHHQICLYSCGWKTTTTKGRLNAVLNGATIGNRSIFQKKGEWFVLHRDTGGVEPWIEGYEVQMGEP